MSQLMLLCRVGDVRYALETQEMVEVIHRVTLSRVPGAPEMVVGRLNYHGQVVPVLDLGLLLRGHACRPALGTRIVLMTVTPPGQSAVLLGLLIEQVTETIDGRRLKQATEHVDCQRCEYLGETLLYRQEMIQCLRTDRLWMALSEQPTELLPV